MTWVPRALILGAALNAYLAYVCFVTMADHNRSALVPAQIFVVVCGYRCAFPNRYNNSVVLWDTWLSSLFLTRVLATFAEIAWIWQLAWFLREQGGSLSTLIAVGSWIMVASCVVAQCCVWSALLFETKGLMFYEEALWTAMFVINTAASAQLYVEGASDGYETLLVISIVFGLLHLPFQLCGHLPDLAGEPRGCQVLGDFTGPRFKAGLQKALYHRVPASESEGAAQWGGLVGLVWFVVYMAVLPLWPVLLASYYPPADGLADTRLEA